MGDFNRFRAFFCGESEGDVIEGGVLNAALGPGDPANIAGHAGGKIPGGGTNIELGSIDGQGAS